MQLPFFKNIKSPHIKKYAANTGWLFADNFLKQIINLAVGVFLTRYLNPEGFGNISYASTYMQLLNPIALLGLNAIAIKEMVNHENNSSTVIGTTFYLKLAAALFTFFILIFCAFWIEPNLEKRYFIIVVGLSYLTYPFQVIDYYFQSKLISKYTVVSQQIATISSAVLKVIGIVYHFPVEYFVWLIVIELCIATFIQIYIYKIKIGRIYLQFDKIMAKKLLKESFPIIFTGFFIVIYMRVDQLMIEKMLNTFSVGNFAAAIKLSEAFYVVPSIIAGSLFPAIINGLKISKVEYMVRMKRLYSIFTLICISVTLVIVIISDFLVNLLYGSAYIETAAVLRIHFCNSIFVFFGVAYSQAFIVEGLQKFTTINTIIGALLNVMLNLILIPKIGLIGSAYATLIAQFYSGFLCLVLFSRTRPHFFLMVESFNIIKTIRLYSAKIRNVIHE
ncbi:MAG: flippase [Bacteroidia bacterium]|nr:flippase [Bacteroidia bacterium]